jgi:hypothetical protein
MYSDKFQIEGLISSPSYGEGSKQEIYQLIDLYEQDFELLAKKKPRISTTIIPSIGVQAREERFGAFCRPWISDGRLRLDHS